MTITKVGDIDPQLFELPERCKAMPSFPGMGLGGGKGARSALSGQPGFGGR